MSQYSKLRHAFIALEHSELLTEEDDLTSRAALLDKHVRHHVSSLGGGDYNLVLMRRFLLVVMRSQESAEGLAFNALAFAGSFAVKSEQALENLRLVSPLRVLEILSIL